MNLWALVLALIGVLGYVAAKLTPDTGIEFNAILAISLTVILIDSTVSVVNNIVTLATPPRTIKPKVLNLRLHADRAITYRIILLLLAYLTAALSLIYQLGWPIGILAALTYFLKISLAVFGLLIALIGGRIPITNTIIESGRKFSAISIFVRSITVILVLQYSEIALSRHNMEISIGIYAALVIFIYITKNMRDLSAIDPYIEIRRRASMCEEAELEDLTSRYKSITEGDSHVEYLRSWYKEEFKLIDDINEISLNIMEKITLSMAATTSERNLAKELINRDFASFSEKKEKLENLLKDKKSIKSNFRIGLIKNADENEKNVVVSELKEKMGNLDKIQARIKESLKRIP